MEQRAGGGTTGGAVLLPTPMEARAGGGAANPVKKTATQYFDLSPKAGRVPEDPEEYPEECHLGPSENPGLKQNKTLAV